MSVKRVNHKTHCSYKILLIPTYNLKGRRIINLIWTPFLHPFKITQPKAISKNIIIANPNITPIVDK